MNNIIASDLYEIIHSKENIDNYLNDILELFVLIKERGNDVLKSDDIWNYQINGIYFIDWLYSKEDPELVDLKDELLIYINKARSIDEKNYNEYESYLVETSSNFYNFSLQFVFLGDDSRDEYHNISTLSKYYTILRWYLKQCPNRQTLYSSGKEAFPNLYFHNNVLPSLRTLNNSFESIIQEVIEHLEILELYSSTRNNLLNIANREKCQEIINNYSIDCSPEADRDKARIMSFEIENSEGIERINCEYHTKFKKIGRDKTKQDRIYFSFGNESYKDGKMIIYHIGDHV